MIFAVIPAVILFLYGIDNFSEEVRHLAGEHFRTVLQKATKTSLRGALAGAAVTAIVQSSTATTIIVVGLVNAGAISFLGSLGLIIGANVGTTLTAQLVAFKLTAFAPAFLILGFVLTLIRSPYRSLGKPIFYFGLVFYSLNLISSIVAPLQGDPSLLSLFSMTSNVFTAIIIGFIITNIFQSSSVTAGLVVVMAQSNLITATQAIPMILGANIGTTLTGLVVSLRMNAAAKRTAVAQFFFNLLGGADIFALPGFLFRAHRQPGRDGGPAGGQCSFDIQCQLRRHLFAADKALFPVHPEYPAPKRWGDRLHNPSYLQKDAG